MGQFRDHDAEPERIDERHAPGAGGFGRTVFVMGADEHDGTFSLVGGPNAEFVGWSATALRCAPYWEWVHPDDRDVVMAVAERVVASGDRSRFWPVELRVLGRDRRYWWTSWQLWQAINPPQVCAAGVDFLGRNSVRGPPIGTWRWNIDDNSVVWSPEVLDMFAVAVGPPASYEDFLSYVHDDDRTEVDRAMHWSLLSGEYYEADFRLVTTRGGRDRWFHTVGRFEPPVAEKPGRVSGIVKDLNPPRRSKA